jgi:two-component system, NarL family, response regulator DegU
MMADEITVLIADDHPIFRRGLREIIEAEPGLRLVAHVEDGEAAWHAIQQDRPRVAVLDVDMPRKDGLAVVRAVKEARLEVATVLLTIHRNERLFNTALDLGVDGFVLKDSAIAEIVSAIKATAAGQRYVTPLLTEFLLHRHSAGAAAEGQGNPRLALLTETERRVLALVAEYKTSREIANALFISVRTVERHRANIVARLDLRGAHALLQFAIAHKADI